MAAAALSPLRFAGNKQACLEALDAHFDSLGLRPGGFAYYEPMCGSLAVGLHVIDKYRPSVAHIADCSPDLVNFFVVLRGRYAELASALSRAQGRAQTRDEYYELRRRYNGQADDPVTAAAHFYLLNRSCFNGVYRVNRKGEYNVPFGEPRPVQWAQLRRAHEILSSAKVVLECADVEGFLARHAAAHRDSPGDALVYCDPPYLGTDRTLYQPREHFDADKHRRLRALLDGWAERRAHVAANNANRAEVAAIYEGWEARPIRGRRTVGASVASRGDGFHEVLLFRNPHC